MDKKTLVLFNSVEFFISFMENAECDVQRLYKKKNKLMTFIKKVSIKFKIFSNAWYGEWISRLDEYHTIIIFATEDYTFIKYLNVNYPDIKLIFWYWNPAFRVGLPRKELFKLAEVWSFDPKDCLKYGLSFNSTFYFKDVKINKNNINQDVLFLGINKGRRPYLNNLEEKFNELGISTKFLIVPDKKEKDVDVVKPIPYQDYLNLVSESTCILDLMPVGQSGLTLRPMESIFLNKKLISNDLSIMNEKFYNSNNVFLLGHDDLNDLKNFIEKPYINISREIVEYYDFNNWLSRFKEKYK